MPDPLLAEQFAADPRLAEARILILDALADHQQKLTGPRPADPARKVEYDQLVAHFADLRGGPLYFPFLGSGFGRGALVELADGSVKYDFITGIGVHYFGHGHPLIVAAALDAAVGDTIMQGNLQQNVNSVALSRKLTALACRHGAKLPHCFLATSGAMANENALKIAFQKHAPASRVLAFENCFMGRTMVLSQITDRPGYREGLPKVIDVDYVPYYDESRPAESTAESVRVLKRHLSRYPGQHAVMSMELVVGEGGYFAGTREFFLALIEVLRAGNVAVMFDEIQTFGRLTQPFAFQHFGLDEHADLVSVGKLTQVCATFFRDEYKPRPGLVSQTFTGSTSTIVAAGAIIDHLLEGDYFGETGRIAQVRQRFVGHFEAIRQRNPAMLRGPYGAGGMIAFTPLEGTGEQAKKVALALYDAGVISFIAGSTPARVRFLPPIAAITDDQIDAGSAILEQVLGKISAS